MDTHDQTPEVWWEFIDDIFYVWNHGSEELERWLQRLNNFHDTIKFTMENSRTEVNFLDTTVKRGSDNKLYTDLYIKPINTNIYLNYNSAYPPSTKRSIPYSKLLRIKRIISKEEDFQKHAEIKLNDFREKGYPKEILQKCKSKVEQRKRENLLNKNKDNVREEEKTYLISSYRPGKNIRKDIIQNNWDLLDRGPFH